MIYSKEGDNILEHDSFKSMFNEFTKDGSIVVEVKDGEFKLNKNGNEIIINFFKSNIENTKTEMENEIIEFRNVLRENLKSLIDSGINIPKEEKEKLAAKFDFIKLYK